MLSPIALRTDFDTFIIEAIPTQLYTRHRIRSETPGYAVPS